MTSTRVLPQPARGEVWLGELSPVRGYEQGGQRPSLIVSGDIFNYGPADLVMIVPLTSTIRRIVYHVPISPPQGGLRQPSVIECDQVRTVAKERLTERWGVVSARTMADVEDRLRVLLQL